MKSKVEIQEYLKVIEADERLHYSSVDVFINAPLALIQTVLEAKSDLLRWVLGLSQRETGEKYDY